MSKLAGWINVNNSPSRLKLISVFGRVGDMKKILQSVFLNIIAIIAVSYITQGLYYSEDIRTLLFAAGALALINAFLKPFLKVLFLPINVITLGLFSWFINVIVLYLTTLVVPGFEVHSFEITLFGTTFIFGNFIAYIAIAFLLSLSNTLISWIITWKKMLQYPSWKYLSSSKY